METINSIGPTISNGW